MQLQKKHRHQQLRRWRIRNKVAGTPERPRLTVCFTGQHIYVQFIDDSKGVTLAAASTRGKGQGETKKLSANVESAKKMGAIAAEVAKSRGIASVVFDRAGAKYHGKVKALADAAREGGLKF